ncbi:MAG: hypothetical protein P8R42_02765 [Candidatus Binatia bacterium]|nr:hypothetical protein [Candidatus Binatia bacterium]
MSSEESITIGATTNGQIPNNGMNIEVHGCGPEQCDGGDLGGQTCAGLGFSGEILRCSQQCQFDTGLCTNSEPGCRDGFLTERVIAGQNT